MDEIINKAKKLILEKIPKDQLISIYIFGSYVREDFREGSDIDLRVIVKESKYIPNVRKLNDITKHFKPEVGVAVYSIWEMKHHKRSKLNKTLGMAPGRWLRYLNHYKKIYGETLKSEDYKIKSVEDHLRGMEHAFIEIFIPRYKEFGFQGFIKQVLWLENLKYEQKTEKNIYSFKELAKHSKLAKEAYKHRQNKTKNEKIKQAFVEKVRKSL